MRVPLNKADGVEVRLDLFPSIDLSMVENFLQNSSCPVMLTLRRQLQGGKFQGSEAEREALIEQLLALKPSFFDLEYDMDPTFLHETIQKYPQTKFIISYHHFEKTPVDLENIYPSLQVYAAAYSYKIAVMVSSTNQALKMLLFGKNHPKVSVICMGERGEFARVLGPVMGNLVDYACVNFDEKTAPRRQRR